MIFGSRHASCPCAIQAVRHKASDAITVLIDFLQALIIENDVRGPPCGAERFQAARNARP